MGVFPVTGDSYVEGSLGFALVLAQSKNDFEHQVLLCVQMM